MKGKILVVDDEELVRNTMQDILSVEGYDVDVVESGEAALNTVRENIEQGMPYELILLDIKMPGLDGIEVLKEVNHIDMDLKVILLTGHGSMESAIEALRLGAHDYLRKPATAGEILTSISRAFNLRAEQQRKRMLIEQLETSVKRLKDAEGIYTATPATQGVVTLENGVTVDLARREMWMGDTRVSLTPTEGKLMKVFVENRGRVMSHQDIVLQVQGYEATDWEAPEVLRPIISRLRRKLNSFPDGEKWIANVRGTGYVFDLRNGSSED